MKEKRRFPDVVNRSLIIYLSGSKLIGSSELAEHQQSQTNEDIHLLLLPSILQPAENEAQYRLAI